MENLLNSPQNINLQFLQIPYINCLGALHNETSFKSKPHFHEKVTELQFFSYGTAEVSIDGTLYLVGPGDLAVYESNIIHYDDHTHSKTQNLSYFVRFHEYQLSDKSPNVFLPDGVSPIIHTESLSGEFQFLFESMLYEYEHRQLHSESLAENNLLVILNLIYRIISPSEVGVPSAASGPANSLASAIKTYIDNYYTDDLSLKNLSRQFSVSISTLNRIFKDEIGVSPIKYLSGVRIAEAKRLLAKTALLISEIAVKTGFSTTGYFCSQFKHIVGTTPTDYRMTHQNMNDYKLV